MKNIFSNEFSKAKSTELKKLCILYINDDISSKNKDLELLKSIFNKLIYINKIDKVLSVITENSVDVVILDLKINGKSGLKFAKKIKKLNQFLPVIIKTSNYKKKHLIKAFDIKIDGFLENHISADLFIKRIIEVGEKYLLRKTNIRKRKILQSILDNQSGLVMLTDFDTISYCSKSFLNFFNISHQDELFNRYENILDICIKHDDYLHADSKEEFLKKFKSAKAIKKVILTIGKDFIPKAFHLDIDLVESFDKTLYIITLTNISIMQEKNIEISNKVYLDTLTGIYNRNKFEETFSYELKRLNRYDGSLCVAILDIDHFKKFNDTYGHLIGDEVLIKIANEVNNNIRKTDLFARWGGEEFVLLMPEASIEDAKIICEKLRIKIENTTHEIAGKVTSSFGITKLEEGERSLKAVLTRCDIALYNAKANGRNRIEMEL